MMLMARQWTKTQLWSIRAAWLVLALVASLYCAWRFTGPSPLETNLLALLPATEADPVAEKAVDTLANALGDRTVFLVTSKDGDHAKAAAKQFGAALQKSGAFASVTAELPPFDMSQIGALYMPYRFNVLTRDDRDAIANGSASLHDALMQRIYNPVRGPLATQLADDPFGWLEHWLSALPLATSNLDLEDNMLVAHRGDATSVLVVTTLPGSAYETQTQHAVLSAVAQAQSSLKTAFPDASVARTGAVFYAESARSASEREVHLIGVASACGIALLMLWVFRSPRLLLFGFVSTALGIVCALAATMLVFGKLHLLTLVFGASLIGEAVDYSIQYFVVYLGAGPGQRGGWNARQGARSVRPALSVALATSLLGYAILAWVPFPALKQIACFAIVGICTAFASVLWLLPVMLVKGPKRAQRRLFLRAATLLARWHATIGGRRTWIVAGVLVLIAIPGWLRLTSDDDIHLLIQRDPALVAQEDQVRNAIGVDNTAQFFVVRGASQDIVLQRAEALGAKLDALSGAQSVNGWQSVTQFVPSAQRQADARVVLAQHVFNDPAALRSMLLQAGYRDEIADAWIASYAKSNATPLTVERWLAAPWSQPYRHLWLGAVESHGEHGYAAIVIPKRVTPQNINALIGTARSIEGVVFVDKAASVSKLFGAYRVDSGIWLAGALLLVLILLMVRYTPRGGIATTLPVLLAIGVTLAAFGYARVPLNLFNCLALMLVLGVGANYAVFLREGCLRDHADLGAVWTGVLLSAATTLLSFGMLALSAMPALKSFGATLALGILVSVLLAPIGMPPERRRVA